MTSQIEFCKPVENKPLIPSIFTCSSYGRWKPILGPGHLPLCNPSTKEEEKTNTHWCPTEASIYSTPSQNSLKVLWKHVFLNSQNSTTPFPPLSRGHESPAKPMTPSTRLLPVPPYKTDPNTDSPATAVPSTLLLPTHPSTEHAWV